MQLGKTVDARAEPALRTQSASKSNRITAPTKVFHACLSVSFFFVRFFLYKISIYFLHFPVLSLNKLIEFIVVLVLV